MSIILENTFLIDYEFYKNSIYLFMNLFLPDLRIPTTPLQLFNTVLCLKIEERKIALKFDQLFDKYFSKKLNVLRIKQMGTKNKYDILLVQKQNTDPFEANVSYEMNEKVMGRFKINLLKNFYHTNKNGYNKRFLGWVYHHRPIKSINKIVNKFITTFTNFKTALLYAFSLALQYRVLEMMGVEKDDINKNIEQTIDFGICTGLTNVIINEMDEFLIYKLRRVRQLKKINNERLVNESVVDIQIKNKNLESNKEIHSIHSAGRSVKINPFLKLNEMISGQINSLKSVYDEYNVNYMQKYLNIVDINQKVIKFEPRPDFLKEDKKIIRIMNNVFYIKQYLAQLKKKCVEGSVVTRDLDYLFDVGLLNRNNEEHNQIIRDIKKQSNTFKKDIKNKIKTCTNKNLDGKAYKKDIKRIRQDVIKTHNEILEGRFIKRGHERSVSNCKKNNNDNNNDDDNKKRTECEGKTLDNQISNNVNTVDSLKHDMKECRKVRPAENSRTNLINDQIKLNDINLQKARNLLVDNQIMLNKIKDFQSAPKFIFEKKLNQAINGKRILTEVNDKVTTLLIKKNFAEIGFHKFNRNRDKTQPTKIVLRTEITNHFQIISLTELEEDKLMNIFSDYTLKQIKQIHQFLIKFEINDKRLSIIIKVIENLLKQSNQTNSPTIVKYEDKNLPQKIYSRNNFITLTKENDYENQNLTMQDDSIKFYLI